MRTLVTVIVALIVIGIVSAAGFVYGKRTYEPPEHMEPATSREFAVFQHLYNQLAHYDEVGDWRTPSNTMISPDFTASNSEAGGQVWSATTQMVEARERTHWQSAVVERRLLTTVLIGGGEAKVRYSGTMACNGAYSDGGTGPYEESWSAEDTWSFNNGHWQLAKTVVLRSEATSGGEPWFNRTMVPRPKQ
ncbi:MAG TPA: hypothetical protein VGK19_15050 [Capsulimonadaceae bacterium]